MGVREAWRKAFRTNLELVADLWIPIGKFLAAFLVVVLVLLVIVNALT